jgi:hypothetical protein
MLQTWPEEAPPHEIDNINPLIIDSLRRVVDEAHSYGELFVAMSNGPYMLLLKADNANTFLEYATRNPTHKVIITWTRGRDNGRTWLIEPVIYDENTDNTNNTYALTFKLPSSISDWVFDIPNKAGNRAINIKQSHFSNITIYRHIDGKDYIFRLEFDLVNTRRHLGHD